MSNSSANDLRTALNDAGSIVQPRESLLSPLRTLAFWVAVVLPFLYVPLLITGLNDAATTGAFVALLALNALTLLVGHPHRRE